MRSTRRTRWRASIARARTDSRSWPDFIEWLVAATLLSGNGLAEVVTDSRGELVELRAVPWSWSAVQLLPNGRLAYDVTEQMGLFGTTGRTRRLLRDSVLHVRDRSDDGILGISRLRRASAVLGAAMGLQDFAAGSLAQGIYPSGVVTAEGLAERARLCRPAGALQAVRRHPGRGQGAGVGPGPEMGSA